MGDLTYDHMTYYKQVAVTISKQEVSREQRSLLKLIPFIVNGTKSFCEGNVIFN